MRTIRGRLSNNKSSWNQCGRSEAERATINSTQTCEDNQEQLEQLQTQFEPMWTIRGSLNNSKNSWNLCGQSEAQRATINSTQSNRIDGILNLLRGSKHKVSTICFDESKLNEQLHGSTSNLYSNLSSVDDTYDLPYSHCRIQCRIIIVCTSIIAIKFARHPWL